MTGPARIATWPCGCKAPGCWCHSRVQAMGEWCDPCKGGSHARLPLPWPAQGPQDGRTGAGWPIRTPAQEGAKQ